MPELVETEPQEVRVLPGLTVAVAAEEAVAVVAAETVRVPAERALLGLLELSVLPVSLLFTGVNENGSLRIRKGWKDSERH